MFETFRTLIVAGGYDLADLTARIKTMYALGDLTEEQMKSLLEQAQANANPEDSYAPLAQRVTALEEWQTKANQRLDALKTNGGGQSGGDTGVDEDEPADPADEWPEFVQPTGAHDAYQPGDHITWNGEKYECVMDGCVWNPGDYPSGWRKVEETEADGGDE